MTKIKNLFVLHLILVLFSVTSIFSKLAANEEFLSFKFILFYGLVILCLFIYAIAWQQIIKRMPIVTAYANKAVTVIWGIVFGRLIFGEEITLPKIIGAVIIIAGVYLVVSGDVVDEINEKSGADERNKI